MWLNNAVMQQRPPLRDVRSPEISSLYMYKEVNVMKYKVILQQSEEGFAVSVPGLPGCHSQGATEQEALENIGNAIAEYLEVVAELVRGKTAREVEVRVA